MIDGIIQSVSAVITYTDETSSRYNRLRTTVLDASILEFADTVEELQTKTILNVTKIVTKELIFI